MSEPMVEIPARVALLASKHLYHICKFLSDKEGKVLISLSDSLSNAVSEQCCDKEVTRSIVAARIQESA